MHSRHHGRLVVLFLSLSLARPVMAQDTTPPELSLEDLLNIEVTSVSKKEEQLLQAPSAIYVLTRADIRRAGATSIPEALRLVPGLAVAQINSTEWAISARGFNGLRANKLLVMIDGRSVYSPVTAGVNWDVESIPLDEVERIEIIRGPGASLWGANAVNGVINIVSRDAFDTQGGYAAVHAGSLERGSGFIRYGGQVSERTHFRIYGKYVGRDETFTPGATERGSDDWTGRQAGFRADFRASRRNAVMLSASFSESDLGFRSTLITGINSTAVSERPTEARSANAVFGWTRTSSPSSSFSVNTSFQRSRRTLAQFDATFQMLNVDMQHRFKPASRHDLVWGFGQRFWTDDERNTFMVSFLPDHDRGAITNVFVHDAIAIRPSLTLTLGSKFEHHDELGFNVQPNARISWMPGGSRSQAIWGAVSKAVRNPSRMERDIRINLGTFQQPGGLPTVMSVFGNPELRSEQMTSYEVGYRVEPQAAIQIDTTAFVSRYRDLRQELPISPAVQSTPTPHVVVGRRLANRLGATTYGIESLARWQVQPWWRLEGTYSWLDADFGAEVSGVATPHLSAPIHQGRVGAGFDLPEAFRFDVHAYLVGRIERLDVPAFSRLDARLNHEFSPQVSLAVIGQNLLESRHIEFVNSEGALAGAIPRSAYLRLTWQF